MDYNNVMKVEITAGEKGLEYGYACGLSSGCGFYLPGEEVAERIISGAKKINPDRIELHTGGLEGTLHAPVPYPELTVISQLIGEQVDVPVRVRVPGQWLEF